MLTLGIDLASQPASTAACMVRWSASTATVAFASCNLDDARLLELSREAEVVGIDCPFVWPDPFVRALNNHHGKAAWPTSWSPDAYRMHCCRRTDLFVTEFGIRPLSVSADRIAIPAMRCSWLLSKLGVRDRSGDGRVFEVYPAAALSIWGLREKKEKYKGRKGREVLRILLERLRAAAPWLAFADTAAPSTFTNDHLFDALIAALNARAANLRLTHPPPESDLEIARKEGWIALPRPASFDALVLRV